MTKKTKPKTRRKLTPATMKAVEAMHRALPELELWMWPEDFDMLRVALEEAREAVSWGPFGKGDKQLAVESMEAGWAYHAYCWLDPPPEGEKHWASKRAKSEWAKRCVANLTGPRRFDSLGRRVGGFIERQVYEAATWETRERKKAEREARLRKEREEHEQYFGRPRRPGSD